MTTRAARPSRLTDERGQVVVFFALLLPVILAISAIVAGIGNWHVHGRHLQTKADAGAFAGGGEWQFPCGSAIDDRIAAAARLYAGSNNPQVGGVPNANIHVRLNAIDWYDDDSNPLTSPTQADFSSPAGSVCAAMSLDVKVTEDNSFPLLSLIPLFPDIKRRAKVEIQEVENLSGVLPIAVRAPEPVSVAAVFFNENTGSILDVKYFIKSSGITGLPPATQGWTTLNAADPNTWARFVPASATGVAIAISFRGACATGAPPGVRTQTAPCFEDGYGPGATAWSDVNALCNQGSSTQIVNCYYTTGNWPNETVESGLHFIRGYANTTPGRGAPQVESAYLENVSCSANGYFDARARTACQAKLIVDVNLGDFQEDIQPGPGVNIQQTRRADNFEVRYGLVRADGTVVCNFGPNCALQTSSPGNAGGTIEFSTQGTPQSPHLGLAARSRANAVAIEVRMKGSSVVPNNPDCSPQANFSDRCRWFHVGSGVYSTSVNPLTTSNRIAPSTTLDALDSPVQQAFRGSTTISSSIQWLRLTSDTNCDTFPEFQDLEAASQPTGGDRCFVVDMALKGGIAADADEPAILFTDGLASNQVGAVACEPGGQGQILIDGMKYGCTGWWGIHPFNYPGSELCPAPNSLFDQPNPGSPWNDGSWPPMRCIDTRQTGTANQFRRGLNWRLFDVDNSNFGSCPPDAPGFVKGRNYWKYNTNPANNGLYGYKDDNPARDTDFNPADPRLVTIFLSTTDAFVRASQKTYPVTGFISIYITGFATLGDAVNGQSEDPCPGSVPPAEIDDCSGNQCNNYVIWGHILDRVVPGPSATPSGRLCNPGTAGQPCVATLVE